MENRYFTLVILLLSPLVLMGLHIIFVRFCNLFKLRLSRQLSLIIIELLLNLPLIYIVYLLNKSLSSVVYSIIVYNCLGYFYFHFFNLSETARRIRILTEIKDKESISYEELLDSYKCDLVIKNRLDRLVDMGCLKKEDGRYVSKGNILLLSAEIIRVFRMILGFPS